MMWMHLDIDFFLLIMFPSNLPRWQRPLAPSEYLMVANMKVANFNGNYCLKLHGPVVPTRQQLVHTMRLATARHPVLALGIFDEGTKGMFTALFNVMK